MTLSLHGRIQSSRVQARRSRFLAPKTSTASPRSLSLSFLCTLQPIVSKHLAGHLLQFRLSILSVDSDRWGETSSPFSCALRFVVASTSSPWYSPPLCLFPHREDGTPSIEQAGAFPRRRHPVPLDLVSFDLEAHVHLVRRGPLFLTPPFFCVVVAKSCRNTFVTVAGPEHAQTSPSYPISFLAWLSSELLYSLAFQLVANPIG